MFYSKSGEFIIAKFDHQRVLLTPDFQSYPNYTKFIKTKVAIGAPQRYFTKVLAAPESKVQATPLQLGCGLKGMSQF